MKFGVRLRTPDTLPTLNFVEIAQGDLFLWENLYQKFEIFTIFIYLKGNSTLKNIWLKMKIYV